MFHYYRIKSICCLLFLLLVSAPISITFVIPSLLVAIVIINRKTIFSEKNDTSEKNGSSERKIKKKTVLVTGAPHTKVKLHKDYL